MARGLDRDTTRVRPPKTPLRRAVLWAFGVAAALLLVCGVFAAIALARVVDDLRDARALLVSAGEAVEQGRLAESQGMLSDAEDALVRSTNTLHTNPWISAVSWAPVVSQNLASLRASVETAAILASGGSQILSAALPLQDDDGRIEVPLRSGAIPLNTVRAVQREVADLARTLPPASTQPSRSMVVPQLADLQEGVFQESDRRRNQLDTVGRALNLLSDMAGGGGDRRYLLAVANTAEMRGAGGMMLTYGILESHNGDFSLGEFGSVDEIPLAVPIDPELVGLPRDFVRRWGSLTPTQQWRNVTVGADFSLVIRAMQAMFYYATGLIVDGVIQIDSHGLAAILRGTGPVDVPTVGQVTAENVVDLTLNRAYTDFPDRDQRQEVLGDVAEEVFRVLVEGRYDSLRLLGEALYATTQERHIIMGARTSPAATELRHFGADGSLPPPEQEYVLLTVQNQSGNKLDYYVDTSVELTGSRPVGQVGTVTARIRVVNTAPPGVTEPVYVFGTERPGFEPGLYRGIVSLYLPRGATLTGSQADEVTDLGSGTEGGRPVVSYAVAVPAGDEAIVTLEIRLPPRGEDDHDLTLVPVPRVRPTTYRVEIDTGAGRKTTFDGPLMTVTTVTDGRRQGGEAE